MRSRLLHNGMRKVASSEHNLSVLQGAVVTSLSFEQSLNGYLFSIFFAGPISLVLKNKT